MPAPVFVDGVTPLNAANLNAIAAYAVPTGAMMQFGGSAAPSGWAICDGSSQLRTDPVYAALFAVVGTAYGAADGTHFNLPDLRGRVAVGLGTHADVAALGNSDGQAVANRRPKHRTTDAKTASGSVNLNTGGPSISIVEQGGGVNAMAGGSLGIQLAGNHIHNVSGAVTVNLGGSIGTNNANDALDTPSYAVVNFIIKL